MNTLCSYLKNLKKQIKTKQKKDQQTEVIKIRTKINEIENRKQQRTRGKKSMKQWADPLHSSIKLTNLYQDWRRKREGAGSNGEWRENTITKVRNEDIPISPAVMRRILREDCKQLYKHKFDNLEDMEHKVT